MFEPDFINPPGPQYHQVYSGDWVRCSCDTSTTTVDCGGTNLAPAPAITSTTSDPYCVDVATYAGSPITYGAPFAINVPTPIVVYEFSSFGAPVSGPAPGSSPGFIAKNARVGVNTLNPTAALDVIGDVRFSSYVGTGIRNL